MKIQTLLNSSRMMMFENELEGFDYSAHGTAFLCFYHQQLYAVTAGHVIGSYDAEALRVMIHPEVREFLPHNAQVTLVSAEQDDPDYADLAILPIELTMFDQRCFRDSPPFDLSEQLVNSTPPPTGKLVFRGFPSDKSGINFDTAKIKVQPVILEGDRVGRAPMAHCHVMRLRDVSHCSTLDGFSGSPVFWISNQDPTRKE
ncbi:MAG: serine protease, partial [Rhodospirillaceae bacterium]|nr:serine protease [Rhodospirillaceae bacterium]